LFAAKKLANNVNVIGVDIVEAAISDAKNNAENNNLSDHCEYVCGRAESVLPNLIRLKSNDGLRFHCVVDPPRSGLHKSVIRAIRECDQIESMVYVSCNPKSLAEDLKLFCEPLTSCPEEEGIACNMRFEPLVAKAVDMFPHTHHCEVVVKLIRKKLD
jgi:tRNA/tmRNA/rRNA uracil-C5-methylase (TrmA/RlmC/RlmD family)